MDTKVSFSDNHCDVCGEHVCNQTVTLTLKNGSSFKLCIDCLRKAEDTIAPFDLYSPIETKK